MAIRDTSKTSFVNDNDNNVFIGIRKSFNKSEGREGWFEATSTTIEAVKENIKNLLQTEKGERLMQPGLGLSLRAVLFNPMDVDTELIVQEEIVDAIARFFPSVSVEDIVVDMNGTDAIGKATMRISIDFMINNNPNLLDSVVIDYSAGTTE